jgi:O-antigen ligase
MEVRRKASDFSSPADCGGFDERNPGAFWTTMKWVVIIVLTLLVRPLSIRLRDTPDLRLRVFALAAFLPFVLGSLHLYWAVLNWGWSGYIKGAEVSLLDFIALSLYLSLPRPERRLPFRGSMAIYLAATALSAIQAMHPVAALFYPLQLGRTFLVCATVYRGVCADRRVPEAVLKGLAAGMLLEVAVAGWQRAHGVLQTPGTFSSQNHLGMISQFVIFPFFAVILGGRRGRLAPAVVAAGLVIAILTASRGTIALDFLGLAIVFVLSAVGQWTPRKAKVLWAGVAALTVFVFFAASSLQQRFHGGTQLGLSEEDHERVTYKRAAAEMLADHPMGVGANHFTIVANLGGYFTHVGEFWGAGRASNVHNVYWLVAAETGYIGLVAFVPFLISPLIAAWRCGFRHRRDPRGGLLLGLGVALLVVYVHSFEEWIFVVLETQYVLAIVVGLVAGLTEELHYWRPKTGVPLRGT